MRTVWARTVGSGLRPLRLTERPCEDLAAGRRQPRLRARRPRRAPANAGGAGVDQELHGRGGLDVDRGGGRAAGPAGWLMASWAGR